MRPATPAAASGAASSAEARSRGASPFARATIGIVPSRPPRSDVYPWYDSVWLTEYTRAKTTIETTRPEVLRAFVDAFRIFHTPPSFRVRRLERIFDDDTLAEIQRVARSLRPTDLELHEARTFGRFVVHDHPYFTALHHRIVPIVSEVVGEPVEPAYSFLSLYGNLGVCPLHLDSPEAKWTLDLCVGQSSPWPIYFSQVCPWPELAPDISPGSDWEEQIKRSPSLRFTSCTLEPGQAVVFSGSSQWHYRDAIPDGPGRKFAELLFFHFVPKGSAELLRPENWARLFGVRELRSAPPAADAERPAAG